MCAGGTAAADGLPGETPGPVPGSDASGRDTCPAAEKHLKSV